MSLPIVMAIAVAVILLGRALRRRGPGGGDRRSRDAAAGSSAGDAGWSGSDSGSTSGDADCAGDGGGDGNADSGGCDSRERRGVVGMGAGTRRPAPATATAEARQARGARAP